MNSKFLRWRLALRGVVDVFRGRIYGLLHRDIVTLLDAADPKAPLAERISWLEDLVTWIRAPVAPTKERVRSSKIQAVRVRYLLQLLERNEGWKRQVAGILVSVLEDTDPLNLFCLTGLTRQAGLISEASDRVLRRLLPAPRDERDLSELFTRIFNDQGDSEWLETLGETTLDGIRRLLEAAPEKKASLRESYDRALRDAITIISSQVESLGLSPEIRERSHVEGVRGSAFFRLRVLVVRIQAEAETRSPQELERAGLPEELFGAIQSCRKEVNSALAHLEEHGVSVAIVYRLEQIELLLRRLEVLARLRFAPGDEERARHWLLLLAELVRNGIESSRLRSLIQGNVHLVARKIVERTGASGEHYITRSKREYLGMLVSASGGGVLTAGTAWLKFAIGKAHAAMFFEGFFSWLNYSGSFLLMQGLHFTLATKQPSMTAPALAARLRNLRDRTQVQGFIDMMTQITRSQFAAALGNVGAVIPTALLIDQVFFLLAGRHILSPEYAVKVIGSLNPLASGTIPFAALTGALLWLSSLCAGWGENWLFYRRLPEALAQSPVLRSAFGPARTPRVASWISQNTAGLFGNLSLGFFLAFTPVLGRFFGLALDVRHVTLSAGSLTFALCALEPGAVTPAQVVLAAVGIGVIGVLNFGVSFILALYVAIKARKIKRAWIYQLAEGTWLQMRYKPLDFLFPAREEKAEPGDG